MSSLDLFRDRKWFRRLWLFALGLVLGYGYWVGLISDVFLIPAGFGLIIGILTNSLLGGIVNTVIVMIGYVVCIVASAMAGNLGSGQPFVFEYYQELIANVFYVSTLPLVGWIPAMLVGFVIRFFLLKLRDRSGQVRS